jgi:hypothetical protein
MLVLVVVVVAVVIGSWVVGVSVGVGVGVGWCCLVFLVFVVVGVGEPTNPMVLRCLGFFCCSDDVVLVVACMHANHQTTAATPI